MKDDQALRNRMVEKQLVKRGITDRSLIEAMRRIPRHQFVPPSIAGRAYEDCPLPIGEGQTISQPYIVALMTEHLRLKKSDVVLEIGTGSGYQTAILAELSRQVFSVEAIQQLGLQAQQKLRDLRYRNVKIMVGDGTEGFKESDLKFNAIMVTAAAPSSLNHLFDQLSEGGRMVIPIGDHRTQVLTLFRKQGEDIVSEKICSCVFVPLVGRFGWNDRPSN